MLLNLISLSLLSLGLPLATWANAHAPHHNRHNEIAKRQEGGVSTFRGSRWTFYDVGLGACGQHNVASDHIVALNSGQYGGGYPGPNCFKTITMRYNGKTTQAKIMDECPGCPWGGLDLSRGLFNFFDSEDKGVLTGEWWFGGGLPAPKPPKPTPKPTTSTRQPPKSTKEPESSTTSAKKSSASSSASSTQSKSASSTSEPAVTPTPLADVSQNLGALSSFFVNLGGMVMAGAAV